MKTGSSEASDRGDAAGPIRAFFGLPLPAAQRAEVARYVAECSSTAADFRWVVDANLHLTVRFIGYVQRAIAAGIAERLAAQRIGAIRLELGELGTFKRGRAARVVWMGLRSGADEARELAAQVEAECVRGGLDAETRALEPHLTLARSRAREGAPLPALPDPPRLAPWVAGELVLYSSHLQRAGAVYEPLIRVPLAG